jgi:hypothetical protein
VSRRRAFALPTIVIVALIFAVMLTVMIERNTAQVLLTHKQYESYTFSHATRGVGEAVDAWIRSNQSRPIADALGPDGWAFDLEAEGGATVRVYLHDGQGLALAELAGLRADALDSGVEILRALRDLHPDRASSLVRREGPLAVSVNAAPPEVLEAVVDSVMAGSGTRDIIAELTAGRAGRALDDEGLTRLIDASHADGDAKPRLKALLTASPILWRVEAQARSRATGIVGDRFAAWAVISRGSRTGADRAAAVQRSVSVFGWEKTEDR